MLTYHEVMTTDLGLLTTAAAKWDAMAGELKKVETRYGDTVQKITMGETWSGLSAGTAQSGFAATRYEYAAAQSQAKAIASLLRDAHEKFTDLKKKLESARDDALAAGMTVSEQGHVAFDYAKLTPSERSAYHHAPDGQTIIREAVAKWQLHINDRVKAVTEADQSVKTALEAAVVDSNKDAFGKGADGTLNGFNEYAEGDLAKAGKPKEAEVPTKTDGGHGQGRGHRARCRFHRQRYQVRQGGVRQGVRRPLPREGGGLDHPGGREALRRRGLVRGSQGHRELRGHEQGPRRQGRGVGRTAGTQRGQG